MNIHNLVFTLIFYSTAADMDIIGDISFDLLIHQSKYSGSESVQQEDISKDIKKQAFSSENQYVSSNENNQESQGKKTRYTIKENSNLKFKQHRKLKSKYAMSKKKNSNVLRTAKLPEKVITEISNETTLDNNFNEIAELTLDESPVEFNKTVKSHKTNSTSDLIKTHKTIQSNGMVTSAPLLECVYQYPEDEQINTLLSDMINLLTKLCTQTNDMTTPKNRRWAKKRFRVVAKMDASAFERSFLHMVKEFKQSCNKITERLDIQSNPCEHQKELKATWKNLLKHSEAVLQKAALQCARELLRTRSRANDSDSMQVLGETLVKELSNVRFRHLEVLCDQFQLCYNDLL